MSVATHTADPGEPRALVAIGRGLRRRCPRCGEGPIFERWLDA